jgi:hypothetical protein
MVTSTNILPNYEGILKILDENFEEGELNNEDIELIVDRFKDAIFSSRDDLYHDIKDYFTNVINEPRNSEFLQKITNLFFSASIR